MYLIEKVQAGAHRLHIPVTAPADTHNELRQLSKSDGDVVNDKIAYTISNKWEMLKFLTVHL